MCLQVREAIDPAGLSDEAKFERDMWEYLITTGTAGMLHLLARKHVLPLTLPVLAALGHTVVARPNWREVPDRTSITSCPQFRCRELTS